MYRRVQAPMLCRAGGLEVFAEYHHGGQSAHVRAYSDEQYKKGQLIEIELMSKDEPLVMRGKVRFVDRLAGDHPARYDIGFDVLPLSKDDLDRLNLVLV